MDVKSPEFTDLVCNSARSKFYEFFLFYYQNQSWVNTYDFLQFVYLQDSLCKGGLKVRYVLVDMQCINNKCGWMCMLMTTFKRVNVMMWNSQFLKNTIWMMILISHCKKLNSRTVYMTLNTLICIVSSQWVDFGKNG